MHDVHIIVPVSEQYRYSIGTVSALYTTLIGKPIRGDVHRDTTTMGHGIWCIGTMIESVRCQAYRITNPQHPT
jgi:hypothetical protein